MCLSIQKISLSLSLSIFSKMILEQQWFITVIFSQITDFLLFEIYITQLIPMQLSNFKYIPVHVYNLVHETNYMYMYITQQLLISNLPLD